MTESNGGHWEFVLSLYGQPGVSDACLLLQDRCGVDVSVALMAIYASVVRHTPVGEDQISTLHSAATDVRQVVVEPLRTIRRRMKGADLGPTTEQVRAKVKAAELAAEQLEMAGLAEIIHTWPRSADGSAAMAISGILAHYKVRVEGDVALASEVLTNAADKMLHG